jgi:2-phosphosulfolactate phosphatase
MSLFNQSRFNARFEWGLKGCQEIAPHSGVVVVVDVLSFSTAVDVALSRGVIILPAYDYDESAQKLALEKNAEMAVRRKDLVDGNQYSLSSLPWMNAESGTRVVLPSLNGARICLKASELCSNVICGCLRNANAVAEKARSMGNVVSIIAAGEKYPDDLNIMRPAFEDLVGAGAILCALNATAPSPEAITAIGAFKACENRLQTLLLDCESGRELVKAGFREDVTIASELNVSRIIPVLIDGEFRDGSQLS